MAREIGALLYITALLFLYLSFPPLHCFISLDLVFSVRTQHVRLWFLAACLPCTIPLCLFRWSQLPVSTACKQRFPRPSSPYLSFVLVSASHLLCTVVSCAVLYHRAFNNCHHLFDPIVEIPVHLPALARSNIPPHRSSSSLLLFRGCVHLVHLAWPRCGFCFLPRILRLSSERAHMSL